MKSQTNNHIAKNKKAFHNYNIHDKYEAGIALAGTEVKSIRHGKVSFKDSYATLRDGEVWLLGLHISPYSHGNINNHDPERDRKLLLHKREIRKLIGKVREAGFTLVPLDVHFKNGKAKVTLALATGKKQYDKRESIKKRDQERDARRKF